MDIDVDAELAALEKELEDLEEAEKDKKGGNKNNNNNSSNQPQNIDKSQNQKQINKPNNTPQESQSNKPQQKKNISNDASDDIYPEKQEEMYHNLKEMKSLTVLEEEMALCDKIILFKKNKGLDYDIWETKKELAELQLNNTKAMIENGNIDFEEYKIMIMGEFKNEKKLLNYTNNDTISKPNSLKEIIRRINRRIEVIEKELTQNPEEDNGEEEASEPIDNPIDNNSQITNKSNLKPQQSSDQQQKQTPAPQDSEPNNGNVEKLQTNKNPENQIINKEEEEKYKQLINGLIREYNEAYEYFKKNGREKLELKSREDLKILLYAKQKADSGNYKEIKLSSKFSFNKLQFLQFV